MVVLFYISFLEDYCKKNLDHVSENLTKDNHSIYEEIIPVNFPIVHPELLVSKNEVNYINKEDNTMNKNKLYNISEQYSGERITFRDLVR